MWKWIIGGVVALGIGVPVLSTVLSTAATVATAPGRVISKTLETNNIINNYEWFHDAHGVYRARLAQVAQYKKFAANTTDQREKARIRIDLAGVQQSCRDLSAQYNANATKSNRSIFMGKTAPDRLPENACE